MGFRVEERFAVKAPVEAVWAYLIDPRRVVRCLPGAELIEVVDERTFHGNVKVKVGAVVASYRGRVSLVEVDEPAHRVKMSAEGREGGGAGSARMAMESRVSPGADGATDVVVEANVDITGRLVQLGRGGLFQQVAHQLFGEFASCVQATLEAEAAAPALAAQGEGRREEGAPAVERPRHVARPVRAIPILLKAIWAMIVELFHGKRPHARRT